MDLVGHKNPTIRYKKFISRLLNCIRDKNVTEAICKKEKEYLLKQIEERDLMIDTLIKKNDALMRWKREHEDKTYKKISIVA